MNGSSAGAQTKFSETGHESNVINKQIKEDENKNVENNVLHVNKWSRLCRSIISELIVRCWIFIL